MANGRIALIGGSDFVVRPHTGMGMAKAAGDVFALDARLAVVRGAVRTYKLLSDGRRQIGYFHLAGDIFSLE